MSTPRRKLIEVALPLEGINREAKLEKQPFTRRHPRSLHIWWARRPFTTARVVIFAQLVDDPASVPEEFPSVEAQMEERQRLLDLMQDLVQWGNTTNEDVLEKARAEIRKSWVRWCKDSGEDPDKLPPFHDPFAGGGALPLEAQRLGLEAHASDLNPVAVMINKAMIEIPPCFAGRPPVNPDIRKDKQLFNKTWRGAQGLAEDIRYYGQWMRDEAERRIGHLYPKVKVVREKNGSYRHATTDEIKNPKSKIEELTVIAWLWARTVESSNPAYRGCHVPLVTSFWLSTKSGKATWVEPVIEGKTYRFEVRTGSPENKATVDAGTKLSRGANFRCILSQSPLSPEYIKAEGVAGRMGARLLAIVAEGDRGRVYLAPTDEQEAIAARAKPTWKPEQKLNHDPRAIWTPLYGLTRYCDLFTPRQLVALTTFNDLVTEVRETVRSDADKFRSLGNNARLASSDCGMPRDDKPLRNGGCGSSAYAEAVSVYLALALSRWCDLNNSICTWNTTNNNVRALFARQAIPMSWDYVELSVFGPLANFSSILESYSELFDTLPAIERGEATQANATELNAEALRIFSTDPPYYDNIGYADLSDFFYVWLRYALKPVYPELFSTLLVPKAEELVAVPYRHGSKEAAEQFFLSGMTKTLHAMSERAHAAFPVTIYYAFKQTEEDSTGVASTGWQTFLEAVLRAGFSLSGTWPIHTERDVRSVSLGTNALASSIVLVCRPRPADAAITTRKDFLATLRRELPPALRHLQQGNIAPVDLAQASIGPGMGVFSRYSRILESDGTPMKVRTALTLINQTLDEVLAEQDSDFDPETAWAVAWFEQFGFNDGPFGDAETLSKAKNTALNALSEAGIVKAGGGRTRLLRVDELPSDWDPATDKRLTVWEMVHHLVRVLGTGGETKAAELLASVRAKSEAARELAYRLYTVCERRGRAAEAQSYNALVQSWPEIARLSRVVTRTETAEQKLPGME
jgi:putative DNA methylase